MKTPIAVALIIVGAVLVGTPPLSDYLYQRNVVALITDFAGKGGSVTLDGKMGDLYRIGCWLTGSVMIGVAILCSLIAPRALAERRSVRTTLPA